MNRKVQRPWRASLASTLGLLVLALTGCGQSSPEVLARPDHAIVVEVVDGDTIELVIAGQTERVRLLGIDAPESVHPTVPEQCFGAESSSSLAELLPPDTRVKLERDTELRDRYDRLLLYVYRLSDGLFVNSWLVSNGLADTLFYEPNLSHAATLTTARNQARSNLAGLWGSCEGPDQPIN